MILAIARGAILLLGLGAVGFGATELRPHRDSGSVLLPTTVSSSPLGGKDSADYGLLRLSHTVTPFRLGHVPPAVRFGAEAIAPVQGTAPPVPKPVLALSGILWSREPAALVEGIPGVEGPIVLRPGETLGPIQLVSMQRDRVTLRGLDTTWVLTVKEPWK